MTAEEYKDKLIKTLQSFDVKEIDLDIENKEKAKWYRFGIHVAHEAVLDLIKNTPTS